MTSKSPEVKERTQPSRKAVVLIGLGIGEETKGATGEWLADKLDAGVVIRRGGCQAGHNIVTADGKDYQFTHFGCATFDGKKTHLTDMVIDPVGLFSEAVELEELGIKSPLELVTIDENCLVVTPFHSAINRFTEIMRGKDKKGTVGKGVGDVIRDSKSGNPDLTIRVKDFCQGKELLRRKIETIRRQKFETAVQIISDKQIDELPEDAKAEMTILTDQKLVDTVLESFVLSSQIFNIVDPKRSSDIINSNTLVVESSHGTLLHPRYGFAPHTTEIDPIGVEVVKKLADTAYPGKIFKLGVSRCYMTRHGAGPLVSFNREMTDTLTETHNVAYPEANEWLGEFRNGNYDIVATAYALDICAQNGLGALDGLIISYMDVLKDRDSWDVCVAYKYNGNAKDLEDYFVIEDGNIVGIKLDPDDGERHYAHQLRLTEHLKECTPILKSLKAENGKSLEQVFLDFVEGNLNLPVVALSYGPLKEDRKTYTGWEKVFGPFIVENENGSGGNISRPFGLELILAGAAEVNNLPDEIKNSPVLLKEAEDRRRLYEKLLSMFEKINDPNLDIEDALRKGLVLEDEVGDLYKSLKEFISKNPNNQRLLLYLPVQLLPNIKNESGASLEKAKQLLSDTIRDAWTRLLYESEPRANFIDGDVLEPGLGEPERIRKAGHLIPFLMEKGLLGAEEIIDLIEISDDEELLNSLGDGVVAAFDKGLFSDVQRERILQILESKSIAINKPIPSKERLSYEGIEQALFELETIYKPDSEYCRAISYERAKWEKQVKRDAILGDISYELSLKLINGEMTLQGVRELSNKPGYDSAHQVVAVRAVKYAGEKSAAVANTFAQFLFETYKTGTPEVRNNVIMCLNHWHKLGIISDSELSKFDIPQVNLASPFPINIDTLKKGDFRFLVSGVEKISASNELSKYIYPVFLAIGSRVKGYAKENSDFDIAVFIRPEAASVDRERVLSLIRQEVPEIGKVGKILEYRVVERNGDFELKVAPENQRHMVDEEQVHFFTNGVWIESGNEFQNVKQKLMSNYVNLTKHGARKEDVRRQYLRQIELDILQCRLMHYGYRMFYPSYKVSGEENSHYIDWKSDYWDPKYRQIASLLFVSRVFLPDLP